MQGYSRFRSMSEGSEGHKQAAITFASSFKCYQMSNNMKANTRDLEMIFNLLWISDQQNIREEESIVGMCDVPSTTLHWELFKSYLLKNSGSEATDVKVTYIGSDDKDNSISSQREFQLALYTFRRHAISGEIITLKLEKIERCNKARIHAATQNSDIGVQTNLQDLHMQSSDTGSVLFDQDYETQPPKWFCNFMKKYEHELLSEMSQVLLAIVNDKLNINCQHLHPARNNKSKHVKNCIKSNADAQQSSKCTNRKDLSQSSKFKGCYKKCECKDVRYKNQHKSYQILNNNDIGRTHISKSDIVKQPKETDNLMNAIVVGSKKIILPGNSEIVFQSWEVLNGGQVAWGRNTVLRYAWGSRELHPVKSIVACPPLKPGEKGEILVSLYIPETSGSYECYWHFQHGGSRFGHWLGCQINVVDSPPHKFESIELNKKSSKARLQIKTIDSQQLKHIDRDEFEDKFTLISKMWPSDSKTTDLVSSQYNVCVSTLSGNVSECCTSDLMIKNNDEDKKVLVNVSPQCINDEYVEVISSKENQIHCLHDSTDQKNNISAFASLKGDLVDHKEYFTQNIPKQVKSLESECFLTNNISKSDISNKSDYLKAACTSYVFTHFAKNTHSAAPKKAVELSLIPNESDYNSPRIGNSSLANISFDDESKMRLFIFPRRSPGFEVAFPTKKDISIKSPNKEFIHNNQNETKMLNENIKMDSLK